MKARRSFKELTEKPHFLRTPESIPSTFWRDSSAKALRAFNTRDVASAEQVYRNIRRLMKLKNLNQLIRNPTCGSSESRPRY